MQNEQPSFGWLVLTRAWKGTLDTFETGPRAIILALAGMAVSVFLQFMRGGFAAMKEDLLKTGIETVGPVLIVGLAILLWNLWLAPSALAFETATAALDRNSAATGPASPIPFLPPTDWGIWKARGSYAIYEFARILDKRDPGGSGTSAGTEGYRRLLLEDVEEGKLKHIPERVMGVEGYYTRDIDTLTKIKREVALAWARDHEFDVSHVA